MKSLPSLAADASGLPHFHGHRARLKERFLAAHGQGLADYELLELVLFLAIPRGDVKPLAKSLLAKFGSLAALINAEDELILEVPGVGAGVLHVIRLFQALMDKVLRQQIVGQPILTSW